MKMPTSGKLLGASGVKVRFWRIAGLQPNAMSFVCKERAMNKTRTGHMPGSLRGELCKAIEAQRLPPKTRWHENIGGPEDVRRVTGLLWNCTDVVPGTVCEDAGIPRGSSFAQLARQLRQDLDRLT